MDFAVVFCGGVQNQLAESAVVGLSVATAVEGSAAVEPAAVRWRQEQ